MKYLNLQAINQRHQAGFTLIEVMIVVVIVGILSAIAYPNYRAYVERGQRSEGRAYLVEVANRMERIYSDCNAYPANLSATAVTDQCAGTGTAIAIDGDATITGFQSENSYYTITVSATGTRQVYTLTASPEIWTDGDCGNLTLTNTGLRDRSGTGKTVDECWGK